MTTDKKNSGEDKTAGAPKKPKRLKKWLWALGATTAVATGIVIEAKTSYLQSRFFHSIAEGKTFTDTQCRITPPAAGPYDEQLGYTQTAQLRDALKAHNYNVTCGSWEDRKVLGLHLYPIYNEKSQAGLKIRDATGATMFEAKYPQQAYASFDSIPPLLVNSLLFVENRELMKDHPSSWNPAIDWDRFGNALLGQGLKKVGVRHDRGAGGSTLATQIEKFRHSPEGITGSPTEKLRQMLTASVRAYMDESTTVQTRRQIVADYLNTMPLSSYPGFGTVNGYADGMKLWFGTEFPDANRILQQDDSKLSDAELKEKAKVYRESLSLIMAVKKPTAYLLKDRAELEARIDKFLQPLADAGIISQRLKDAVAAERVEYPDSSHLAKVEPPAKSVQAAEIDLMKTMSVRGLYTLNRLDVTAGSTIVFKVDSDVAAHLLALADPDRAKADGLTGYQLLPEGATKDVIYTFTLYEKLPDGRNVLRVQADNFDGPLNFNDGVKLELGSTAKLRTLISYLQAVWELHDAYLGKDPAELKAMVVPQADHITRWALDYLAAPDSDKSLNGMLEASLNRTYSGNPGEMFFTAGGSHHFENFEREENGQIYTVKEAFHKSVNLSFIRIMRDIENYVMSQKMHVDPAIFTDTGNPQRIQYLQKFSDMEGRGFMWKFWGEQKDKSPDEIAQLLADKTHHSPVQLAVVYRSIFPDKPVEDMEAFIRKNCKDCGDKTDFQALYTKYAHDAFNLNDRGYITSIHPLALWMAENRIKSPDMTWEQTADASRDIRQETYKWLFKDGKEHGQNLRIQTMLEKEAFEYIHKDWQKLGYPFGSLVASYATSIGVSGDTPGALADLTGIIQNDGIRRPVTKFTSIEMGRGTPYETVATPQATPGTRVLPEEVTKLVRREMHGVVEEGTGKRLNHAIKLSNGTELDVGVKTGTGDNRKQTFGARGGVKSSEKKSRTATVAYVIGDRFFGTATADVIGPNAKDYKFTSALAAQLLKALANDIRPVLDAGYGIDPNAQPQQKAEQPRQPEKIAKAGPAAPKP